MDVQLATGVPIGFGVLTTDTLAQAEERADPARGDKGYEAADRGGRGAGRARRRKRGPAARRLPLAVPSRSASRTIVNADRLPYTPRTAAVPRRPPRSARSDGGPGAAGYVRPSAVLYENKVLICKDCGSPVRFHGPRPDVLRGKGFRERAAALPRLPDRAQVAAQRRGAPRRVRGGTREMFDAVCAQCGENTTVPFRPRGDRPVYCRSCYTAQNAVRRLEQLADGRSPKARRPWNRSGSTVTPSGIVDQRALPQRVVRERAAIGRRRRRGDSHAGGARRAGDRDLRRLRRRARAAQLHAGDAFRAAAARIRAARPTAVNLAWAVDRVLARADGDVPRRSGSDPRRAARDRRAHRRATRSRSSRASGNVLTHCNTGPLATGGEGTALGDDRRRASRRQAAARVRRRDASAVAGRAADDVRAARGRRAVHADRRRRGRDHDAARRRSTRSSSAPTASRATATPPTRSAPTASRSPPRTTASRSTSPRRARRSTSRSPTAARSRSRSVRPTRSASRPTIRSSTRPST